MAALPAVLLHYADAYTPRQLPSLVQVLAFVQRPVDITTVQGALTWTGWAAWTVLVLLILRETWWHLRHLPVLLRDFEVHPTAVRRTMTGILVGGIILGLATALRTAPASNPDQTSTAAAAAAVTATAPPCADHTSADTGRAEVTVRGGDTLWAIAGDKLGDPLRWPEIYHLSRTQRQDDGHRLRDPDLIYPGWHLHLPQTGTTAITPTAPAPAPPSASVPASSTATSSSSTTTPPAPASAPVVARAAQRHSGTRLPAGAGYVGDALAGAVVLAAVQLSRTRRRSHAPKSLTETNTYPDPPSERETLVLALRTIRHNQHTADQAATPASDQPRPNAGPAPGPATAATGIATAANGSTLGVTELLAQLTEPLLVLTGDGAHDAARALVTTASTAVDPQLVVPAQSLSLLCPVLAQNAAPGTRPGLLVVETVDEGLDTLEEHLLRGTRLRDQDPGHTPAPLHLVAEHLDARQLRRLRHLLTAADTYPLGVLLLDHHSPGLATVEIADDGHARLTGTHQRQNLQFFHLRAHSADALARTLLDTGQCPQENGEPHQVESPEPPPRPSAQFPGPENSGDPSEPVTENPSAVPAQGTREDSLAAEKSATGAAMPQSENCGNENISPARTPTSVLDPSTAGQSERAVPVRITLLGRLAVHGNGTEIDKATSGAIGQLLTYLALHPRGATCEEAIEALWPDRDNDAATKAFHAAKTRLRRLLRDHLNASTSVPFIIASGNGGSWRLDPAQTGTDLDDFHAAVHTARTTIGTAQRLDAFQHAADLYTGDLAAGWDHPWLESPRTHAREQVLALLNELATAAATPDVAIGHLERALTHDPYNEQLHLRLARIHAERGSTDAVQRLQERLTRSLRELDLAPNTTVQRAFATLLNPSAAPTVRR
ncbi:BTAD domain-containing putative transcriptional regulator [Streptacidiphilus sp. N1-10]|uniref:BTAD domain-containing putative transcriptional regulator n=1 Tax=Streptacidiphilus jeojiensis TaxID=3229225 RepID=A0ABV6XI95_9ACTN